MKLAEIENINAGMYIYPDRFVSPFDALGGRMEDGTPREEYNRQRYEEGVRTGNEAARIIISARGTWNAEMKNGSSMTSCEIIGYHAGTSELLRGLLNSDAEIVVHRWGKSPVVVKKANHRIER